VLIDVGATNRTPCLSAMARPPPARSAPRKYRAMRTSTIAICIALAPVHGSSRCGAPCRAHKGGAAAPRCARLALPSWLGSSQARVALRAPAPLLVTPAPESVRAFWQRVASIDIERCPHCQLGALRPIKIVAPQNSSAARDRAYPRNSTKYRVTRPKRGSLADAASRFRHTRRVVMASGGS
jgi:hypothetical protein